MHREPAALDGLRGHIDAVITANPEITIAVIWERLADEHGTTVAYPTLRTYVSNRRPGPRAARHAEAATSIPSTPAVTSDQSAPAAWWRNQNAAGGSMIIR